jgi:hypothetical protein
VFKTWRVLPDGNYEQLDEREDILTEMRFTLEDSRATAEAFGQVRSDTAEIAQQSRALVRQSRRDRRLRATRLRIVKTTL